MVLGRRACGSGCRMLGRWSSGCEASWGTLPPLEFFRAPMPASRRGASMRSRMPGVCWSLLRTFRVRWPERVRPVRAMVESAAVPTRRSMNKRLDRGRTRNRCRTVRALTAGRRCGRWRGWRRGVLVTWAWLTTARSWGRSLAGARHGGARGSRKSGSRKPRAGRSRRTKSSCERRRGWRRGVLVTRVSPTRVRRWGRSSARTGDGVGGGLRKSGVKVVV